MNRLSFARQRMVIVALFSLVVLSVSGCSQFAKVSGTVKFKGKPLTSGAVTFVDDTGRGTMPAYLQADGSYAADHVPIGTVTIVVNSLLPDPPMAKPENSDPDYEAKEKEYKASVKAYEARLAGYVEIPARYSKADTSGKTLEVKRGSNVSDIELE
jgi:hypothetical protein